jgi:hypothetical protein
LVTGGVDRTSFKMNPVRMAAGIKIRSANIFTLGAMHDLRHLGKVSSFKFFRDRSYHFVIAVWRVKTAESRAYENDNSPIKTFDNLRALSARFAAHSTRRCLFCGFADSASGLPGRLLNEPKYRPR